MWDKEHGQSQVKRLAIAAFLQKEKQEGVKQGEVIAILEVK